MPDAIRFARDATEIDLFLTLAPCPSCGQAALQNKTPSGAAPAEGVINLTLECRACRTPQVFHFQIRSATDEPSSLIDVAQWLTLYSMKLEASRAERDKVQSRLLAIEAGQCLEEALRFYHEDNDLPPREAFFNAQSLARLREHPEQFSRQRLLNLRAQLPTPSRMQPKR